MENLNVVKVINIWIWLLFGLTYIYKKQSGIKKIKWKLNWKVDMWKELNWKELKKTDDFE